MSVFAVLLALGAMLAWGDLALRLLGRGGERGTFRLAIAWILGAGLATWLVFLALACGARLGSALLSVGALGALLWLGSGWHRVSGRSGADPPTTAHASPREWRSRRSRRPRRRSPCR